LPEKRRKSIFEMLDEMINKMLKEVWEELDEFAMESRRFLELPPDEVLKERKGIVGRPLVYGFRITIGPDGKPKIEEFGNVKRVGRRPQITEEAEPLVDVYDEGEKIRVVAEIPGVEKDKIKLKAVGRKLIIRASNGDRKYYKEVELPDEVDIKKAKARYKNGVLEVEIPKKESGEEEIGIQVE